MDDLGGKPHYFRKHPHANRAGKRFFLKMPSDGITLTLEPWKVVSCGSLLTLLSLDIWKGFKTPKKHASSTDRTSLCSLYDLIFPPKVFWFLSIVLFCRDSIQQIVTIYPYRFTFRNHHRISKGIYISCPSNPGLRWKKNGGFGKSFGAKEFWKSSFHHLMMVTGRDGHFVVLFRFEEQHEQQTFSEKNKERSEKLIAKNDNKTRKKDKNCKKKN